MSPVGGYAGDSFGDGLEFTYRRLMSNQREVWGTLAGDYTVGSDTIVINGPQAVKIQPGSLLGIDLEVFAVQGWTPTSGGGGTATVIGGFQGSANANHAALDDNGFPNRVYIDPKFFRWDVGVAINHSLAALSAPSNGLFQVGKTTITYVPPYTGYDLGVVPANFNRILEVTFDWPYPDRRFKRVNRWEIYRGISSSKFPSGRGIEFYDGGYPGFNFQIAYGYPFNQLINPSDDMVVTTGLAPSAVELPLLMAELRLMESREIKRNFIESQPDPRKAEDVPAGAILNSSNLLQKQIATRISEEADRLAVQWPRQRSLR